MNALLVLPFVVVMGDDPVKSRLVEDGKKQREMEIARLQGVIELEKRHLEAVNKAKPERRAQGNNPYYSGPPGVPGKVPAKITFHYYHPKDKDAELARIKKTITDAEIELKATKAKEWVTPKLRCTDLEVGQVGILWTDEGPVSALAFQIIDKDNALMEWARTLHWVKMPTAGMVDGKRYVLDKTFHVKGTKQYKTPLGGTKTVLELEVMP